MMQQMLVGLGGGATAEAMGNVHYTMCAGGGARGAHAPNGPIGYGGGGAGGYISSFAGALSGGGNVYSGGSTSLVSPLTLLTLTSYTVTIGASATASSTNGSNTSIAGQDTSSAFTITAIGGGGGASGASTSSSDLNGKDGGSGGGGGSFENGTQHTGTRGSGTTNQGTDGNIGQPRNVFPWYCGESWATAFAQCLGYPGNSRGGGGGGASTIGSSNSFSNNGVQGLGSSITGSTVIRSGGGNGKDGGTNQGWDNEGGGGSNSYPLGKNGILILRYSNAYTISNPGGGLTITTTTVSSDKVSQITAGTGVIEFTAN